MNLAKTAVPTGCFDRSTMEAKVISASFLAQAAPPPTRRNLTSPTQATEIPVEAILAVRGVSPALARRIAAADTDASGVLSLDEVVAVFKSEQEATVERRLFRRQA